MKKLGYFLILLGLATAGNAFHILLVAPERASIYSFAEGVVTEKFIDTQCFGMKGESCKDMMSVRFRFRDHNGTPVETKAEGLCLDWDAARTGSKVYVAFVTDNPKSAKACDTPIDDPFKYRPWLYAVLGFVLLIFGVTLLRDDKSAGS